MLTNWLQRYLSKKVKTDNRVQLGILSGKVGLASNLVLFAIKLLAGVLSGSISIITDAMNNLSDTASSILALFGFYAAAKPADQEHPYGHERYEYISGLLISLVIIFVGGQFLVSSIDRIIHPGTLKMNPLIVILLLFSIIAKLFQGKFYQVIADAIHSNTLKGVAQDSFNDVYSTIVVLLASLVEYWLDWKVDGIAGAVLAIFIIFSGLQMIHHSINDLLGIRPDEDAIRKMIGLLDQYEMIVGYHDLLVHNYGPNQTHATIHIEIDDSWSLSRAHQLIDQIEKRFLEELDVELVCHVDPIAIQNERHTKVYQQIKAILKSYSMNLKFHDFRIVENNDRPLIQFDIVVPSSSSETNETLLKSITHDIHTQIGDYDVEIDFDRLYILEDVQK